MRRTGNAAAVTPIAQASHHSGYGTRLDSKPISAALLRCAANYLGPDSEPGLVTSIELKLFVPAQVVLVSAQFLIRVAGTLHCYGAHDIEGDIKRIVGHEPCEHFVAVSA